MINKTLESFGFGEYYREWITILLKDFEASINTSGKYQIDSQLAEAADKETPYPAISLYFASRY